MKHLQLKSTPLIVFLMLTSCISVNIGDKSFKQSKRYSFKAPSSPFKTIHDESVDSAWLNEKTGTTLSVRSKCQKALDVDLEVWMSELSESLSDESKDPIIQFKKIRFNKRKALQGELNSSIEGYENKLAITTFVKNSCHYIIAMTALKPKFDKDLIYYQNFLKDFKAW